MKQSFFSCRRMLACLALMAFSSFACASALPSSVDTGQTFANPTFNVSASADDFRAVALFATDQSAPLNSTAIAYAKSTMTADATASPASCRYARASQTMTHGHAIADSRALLPERYGRMHS